jgi:hypothetical protein
MYSMPGSMGWPLYFVDHESFACLHIELSQEAEIESNLINSNN